MPSKPKTPVATLAIIERQPQGPRAHHTIPVWPTSDVDALAIRAEGIRAAVAAKTGNVVEVVTHGAAA